MSSVAIMITLLTQHRAQAAQRHCLLLTYVATMPAVPDEMKAPRVMRLEINCCLVVSRFHPMAVSGAG